MHRWVSKCANCDAVAKYRCGGCKLTLYCGDKCYKQHWDNGHRCDKIVFIAGQKRDRGEGDCLGNVKDDKTGEALDPITLGPIPETHFDLDVKGTPYCFDIENLAIWIVASGQNVYPIDQIRRYTELDMDSVRRPRNPITNLPFTDDELLRFADVLDDFWDANPQKKPKPVPKPNYFLKFEDVVEWDISEYPVDPVENEDMVTTILREYSDRYDAFLYNQYPETDGYEDEMSEYLSVRTLWVKNDEIIHSEMESLDNIDIDTIRRFTPLEAPDDDEEWVFRIETEILYYPPKIEFRTFPPHKLRELGMFWSWKPSNHTKLDASIIINRNSHDEYGRFGEWPGQMFTQVYSQYRMKISFEIGHHNYYEEEEVDDSPLEMEAIEDPRKPVFNRLAEILPYLGGTTLNEIDFTDRDYVIVKINFIEK